MRWLKYTLLAGMVLGLCAQSITYRRAGRWSLGPPPPPPRSSTFYGVAWSHTDSAGTTTQQDTVTPPASMASGDLAVLFATARSGTGTIVMSNGGGQTWDSSQTYGYAANNCFRLMWCKFNGTWSANPIMYASTTPHTIGLVVFRPADAASHTWAVHLAADTSRYSTDRLFSITARTTTIDSTVCLYFVYSSDDNAWTPGSAGTWTDGTSSLGWKTYHGSDQSMDYQYKILAAAGTTGAAADSQSARGADAGGKYSIVFK